ncbi:hypothetical protein Pmani_016172 [Petrolisthes manimaculis]|uniref:Uncharacterized protein n=1 Tax=Petrolisthes manimaculis TaxID=1843537 RepID=A0AAE1PS78_9EUCA|nr:hypothetical protein Pmani_016172 [Petrolisthes manimaculis]
MLVVVVVVVVVVLVVVVVVMMVMQRCIKKNSGDEAFTCLAMQERSSNVMEFQISPDRRASYQSGLCSSPASLSWDSWVTQGRVDRFRQSPCPVAGEYTGVIPDAPVLCAKLYSDCNNPEIMFYTVFSCYNRSEVIEEREYRCLGQWSETGVTYTYTERRDQTGYECFAGVMVDDDELYIMEAGSDCQRGLQALSYGMKLLKQAPCLNDPGVGGRVRVGGPTQPPWWNATRNPWLKKTSPPSKKPDSKGNDSKGGVSGRNKCFSIADEPKETKHCRPRSVQQQQQQQAQDST